MEFKQFCDGKIKLSEKHVILNLKRMMSNKINHKLQVIYRVCCKFLQGQDW